MLLPTGPGSTRPLLEGTAALPLLLLPLLPLLWLTVWTSAASDPAAPMPSIRHRSAALSSTLSSTLSKTIVGR